MSDIQGATDESLPPQIEEVSVGGEGNLSPREAAQALSQHRWKRDKVEAPEPAAAPEIPEKETAAPETDTGEQTTETVEPQGAEAEASTPAPLELPRSWSKDQ